MSRLCLLNLFRPRKLLIVLLSTLIGLILSAGSVMVKAAFKKGIDTPELLEAHGMNVYATLPRSSWLRDKTRIPKVHFLWRCRETQNH